MADELIDSALKEAHAACRYALDTRSFHARRTERDEQQRQDDLYRARDRVRLAMVPLRRHLGKAQYLTGSRANVDLDNRVRAASKALQSERRKLWKMQTVEGRKRSKRHETRKEQ